MRVRGGLGRMMSEAGGWVGGWMRRKGWCKCHLSKQQARRGKRDTRSERTQPEDEAGS